MNLSLNTVNLNTIHERYRQNSYFTGNPKSVATVPQTLQQDVASLGGLLVYCLTYIPGSIIASKIYNKFNPKETIPDDKALSATDKMIQDTDLPGNGFKYFVINKNNKEEVLDEIYKIEWEKASNIKKKLIGPERYKRRLRKKLNKAIKRHGAFYYPSKNYALAPEKGQCYLPHEIGHAIVNKDTGLLPLVSATSVLSKLLILMVALSPAKSGKSKFIVEKAEHFIQKHAVALTLLSSVPQLTSEFTASKIALDHTKDTLDKDQQNLLKKKYIYAFSTYVNMSIISACTVKLAVMAKNKITAMKFK